MLTENDVVEAVADHLRLEGWTIATTASTMQTGIDIVAIRGRETLCVEAKGATSSKSATARYGTPFSDTQILSHVARALYASAVVISAGDHSAAIALPASNGHIRRIETIRRALRRMQVSVFFVRDDRSVEAWRP